MKILGFDLETTNLSGLMGRVLCASFIPITEEGKLGKVTTIRGDHHDYRNEENPIDDSELVWEIRERLDAANLIVSWNGKLFDVPFLNARLGKAGYKPTTAQMHLDLMYYAGGTSQRIGSRKLVNVQKFYDVPESKIDLNWETWQLASAGFGNASRKAMSEVALHCEQDVKVLSQLYWKLIPHVRNIHR